MKGNPRIRLASVALGIVLLGVPVWSVTQTRELPTPMEVSPVVEDAFEVDLVIESSVPCRVEVINANTLVFAKSMGASPEQTVFQIPKSGADLVVRATAKEPSQRFAVRVKVSHDGSQFADSSFWGDGELAGVLPVPPAKEHK